MNDVRTSQADALGEPRQYEIRVKGHLAPRWDDWFDGMRLTAQDDGTTVIHGPVADQSELQGLLRKLSEIGLTLVSLTGTAADEPEPAEPGPPRTNHRN